MTAPFEMDGQFGKSKNVRVAFSVVGSPDKRSFSQLLSIARVDKNGNWYPSITAKTAVGQMIGVIRGRPIAENEPINLLDYLNGDFMAMVKQDTKTTENGVEVYGSVVKDTWQPVGQTAMPEPEPEPVAVAAGSANPFLDDED
jgi:hypothetical protein